MTQKYASADSQYLKDHRIRKDDVRILMDWLEKQPHLPKIDEYKVILFLQSCYYRIEIAKTTIENYYTTKAQCPELFSKRSLSSVEMVMESSVAYLLPKPSIHGYSVMFAKILDSNPDNFNCNNLIKYFDMSVSLILRQIGTSEGHVLVVDMDGACFGHVAKVNMNSTKKYVNFLQEAMPVRVKEIHLLNVSAISHTLLNLVKPFLRHDIVEMLHIHGSIDTLYDYVPKEALSQEYGGQDRSINEITGSDAYIDNSGEETQRKENLLWYSLRILNKPCVFSTEFGNFVAEMLFGEVPAQQRKEFEESNEFFLEEEQEVADESKRMGQVKKGEDRYGYEGTFKKLSID